MVFDYCRYRQVREANIMQICENGKKNNCGTYKAYVKGITLNK